MTNARRMKQMVWVLIWMELADDPDGHHSNMFDRIITSMSDMGKIRTDASSKRLVKVINEIRDEIDAKVGGPYKTDHFDD